MSARRPGSLQRPDARLAKSQPSSAETKRVPQEASSAWRRAQTTTEPPVSSTGHAERKFSLFHPPMRSVGHATILWGHATILRGHATVLQGHPSHPMYQALLPQETLTQRELTTAQAHISE